MSTPDPTPPSIGEAAPVDLWRIAYQNPGAPVTRTEWSLPEDEARAFCEEMNGRYPHIPHRPERYSAA